MKVICVYITFSSAEEAQTICKNLVEQKMVACANIFAPHTSIYEWQGKLEQTSEHGALLKSTEDRFPALLTAVKALHSYDEPCIVSWNIDDGSPTFLDWVEKQTLR